MSSMFSFFIILFGCLYSQKCQIGALEAPAKRVSNAYTSVNDRSFYVWIRGCFSIFADKNHVFCTECGGTIISPSEILTARHCVAGQKVSMLYAEIGFNDFRSENDEHLKTIKVGPEQIQFFDVTPFVDSSTESKRLYYPDLAVIYLGKVKIPMVNGRHLSILKPCPPDSKFWVTKFGGRVSAVGLGKTKANDSKSSAKVLQEAELEISKTENNCKIEHSSGIFDDQETLCVIGIKCLHVLWKQLKLQYDNNVRLCSGDSGGPVFRTDGLGRGKCLVGVTQTALHVTSLQKLNEWKKNGYFVSLKNWNDDQKCIANGTYPFSKRRYKISLREVVHI